MCQNIDFDGDDKMKLKYCFILLLLVCFLCGSVYAEDSNNNLTSDMTLQDNNQVVLDENSVSEDVSDEIEPNPEDVLGVDENDKLGSDEGVIYFDANALEDGNGSIDKPYKYLKEEILQEGGTFVLAEGEYELQLSEYSMQVGYAQLMGVDIIGQDCEKTAIYSQCPILFLSDNFISAVTMSNVMLAVLDSPDYQIYSTLVIDDSILYSLMLMLGLLMMVRILLEEQFMLCLQFILN